jgi:hypothetical protein
LCYSLISISFWTAFKARNWGWIRGASMTISEIARLTIMTQPAGNTVSISASIFCFFNWTGASSISKQFQSVGKLDMNMIRIMKN